MIDPLAEFDWASLYARYDRKCLGFDAHSPHLALYGADRPLTDRELYYRLVGHDGIARRTTDPLGWYEALLYWKLYLILGSSNCSFLTNPAANWDSWKRYLRGSTSRESPKRQHLKRLWDRLDVNSDLAPQLGTVIRERSGLEPWREAIVKCPEAIAYCGEREIRRKDGVKEVYLLQKTQMNGWHAELFSYVLQQELTTTAISEKLRPLKLQAYEPVRQSDMEPCVVLKFDAPGGQIRMEIASENGRFGIYAAQADFESCPEIKESLLSDCGFEEANDELRRFCSREEIHDALFEIAAALRQTSVDEASPSP